MTAPQPDTVARLRRIWQDLLEQPDIGPEDDFFALGGHSLMAVELTFRVHDDFAVELQLYEVFETATLHALALEIDTLRAGGRSDARETAPEIRALSDDVVERLLHGG